MKTRIDLGPLSDEAIEDLSLSSDNLWMVKSMDQIFGPFDTNSLKEYAGTHQYLFEDALAQNLSEQHWKPFFQFVQFQRRIPKLIPAQSLVSNDNFLIVQSGTRVGPLTLDELKQKVNAGLISVRSEVSVDNGDTWIKLYEHHEFDRRTRAKAGELPFTPKAEHFQTSESYAQKKLQEIKQKQDEEDALVGLAFISTGNDKGQPFKSLERKKEVKHEAPKREKVIIPKTPKVAAVQHQSPMKKIAVGGVLLIAVGLYFKGQTTTDPDLSVSAPRTPQDTQTVSIDNTDRSVPNKKIERDNAPTTRKPASVKRAEPYRPKPEAHNRRSNFNPTRDLKIDDPRVRAEIERERARGLAYDNEYQDENPYPNDYEESGNGVAPKEPYFNPDNYENEGQIEEFEENMEEYPSYEQVSDFE